MTQSIDTFQQHINLEGTPNFRDLGGRTNDDGYTLKRGKLFRSGFLTNLSNADWQVLGGHKLVKICDFRREDEVNRMPTQAPDGTRIIRLPVGDGSHHTMINESLQRKELTAEKVGQFMVKVNQDFVFEHADAYARLFDEVLSLDEDESLLFHCTAGKDRTGFAAALLLMALDFSRTDIFSDYMLSGYFFRPEVEMERLLALLPTDNPLEHDPRIMLPIMEVRTEYLQAALQKIEQGPGDSDYLRNFIKLSDEKRERLRSKFLTKTLDK